MTQNHQLQKLNEDNDDYGPHVPNAETRAAKAKIDKEYSTLSGKSIEIWQRYDIISL